MKSDPNWLFNWNFLSRIMNLKLSVLFLFCAFADESFGVNLEPSAKLNCFSPNLCQSTKLSLGDLLLDEVGWQLTLFEPEIFKVANQRLPSQQARDLIFC